MPDKTALKMIVSTLALVLTAQDARAQRWVHPQCKPLDITANGPFVQQDDGTLLKVAGNALSTSSDGGKTWSAPGPVIDPGMNLAYVGHVGQFIRTRGGTLVILYLNFDGYKFSWDDARNEPKPDCKLELWAIRSTDGGKTWVDRQRLFDGYNADFMGFIQIQDGSLVATVEHLPFDLKRWVVCSWVSRDDGKTWQKSNAIDLGGRGHHDGAVEPMVVELKDGRLMMLIRTNLDQFWKAFSTDGGRSWRTIQPSGIEASSAPGWLCRLKSGRLALVWNRLQPEGKTEVRRGHNKSATEKPTSWYREELSIAFSSDEGETWSRPTVIVREPGAQLSYPYILERQPGELWVFTRYTFDKNHKPAPSVMLSLKESDFVAGK